MEIYMKTTIKLAVASALVAVASSAQAGITIPAGDWTVDIGGNVNAYYTHTSFSGNQESNVKGAFTNQSANTVQTGLLPSAFGIGGKTRQNDLDVAFQITYFVGSDSADGQAFGNNSINIRQSYLSFGDKSWGTIKAGRDLGLFGSDAILSDMTLLGVGSGAGQGGTTTLGRIGSGYQYADWMGQITYISPNFNGFSFAAGINEGYKNGADNTNNNLGYQAKASYEWAGDVAGKVWVGALSNKHESTATVSSYSTRGWELGAKADVAGFGLVGYYYDGRGLSGANTTATNAPLNGGINYTSTTKTDDNGGYLQGTYTIPGVGTKLGLSYGVSKSEAANSNLDYTNKAWIIGAYHPLTKHLNLVAEYTDNKIEQEVAAARDSELKAKTVSLGAILFF
jgi:predicted porin